MLCGNEMFSRARTILLYYSLPDEPPTESIIERLAAEGRRVVLPRVVSDDAMELRIYTSVAAMKRGAFGILEPTGPLFTAYDAIDVAVVPGMAFDASGHRLGRGRGYYDRLLPKLSKAYLIGVCHHSRLLADIPVDAHDVAMHCVIA